MVWSPLASSPPTEMQKTRWRAVPYTAGRGLDLGCGREKLFDTEFVLGIDNGYDADVHGAVVNANVKMDCKDLVQFSAGSFDYVFSSFLLQYFPYAEVPDVLRSWFRLVKVGGCMCLYLPDENQFPKCREDERSIISESGTHPANRWNVNYERLVAAMEKVALNWDLVEYQQCAGDDEYALWFVFRRLK
jgi:SAM-dependent methyltransferase